MVQFMNLHGNNILITPYENVYKVVQIPEGMEVFKIGDLVKIKSPRTFSPIGNHNKITFTGNNNIYYLVYFMDLEKVKYEKTPKSDYEAMKALNYALRDMLDNKFNTLQWTLARYNEEIKTIRTQLSKLNFEQSNEKCECCSCEYCG